MEVNTMTNQEKIALLEDMLELDNGTLAEDTELADVENWDSMAKLSLIVLMDEEFSKKLSGEQIKAFITITDILDFMG
jgi:acyl carrier protein